MDEMKERFEPFVQVLHDLNWWRLRVDLRNTRNQFAREHPLVVFEAINKAVWELCDTGEQCLTVFHPIDLVGPRIRKNRIYRLEFIFPSNDSILPALFARAMALHFSEPRHNFSIDEVHSPQACSLEVLLAENPIPDKVEELCLDFQTPLAYRPRDRKRRWLIEGKQFNELCVKRLQALDLSQVPDTSSWPDLGLLPYYWSYQEHVHNSRSGSRQFINGMTGPLYLRGDWRPVWPVLCFLKEFHLATPASFGRGYFNLTFNRSFFDGRLKNPAEYRAAFDEAAEEDESGDIFLSDIEGRETALPDLANEIAGQQYWPAAANYFTIEKSSGGERGISMLEPRDQVAQRTLMRFLQPVIERQLEHSCIGYRQGKSIHDARRLLGQAWRDGFCHILESDVASFFDTIPWAKLEARLKSILPEEDKAMFAAVSASIRQPCNRSGKPMKRLAGLLQGSPLSPLLANFYLDEFDEAIVRHGYRLIRYGDDFLVLSDTKEKNEAALSLTQHLLADAGLELKPEKTGFTTLDAGFRYLGMTMDIDLAAHLIESSCLRKTLFIKADFGFIGVEGQSLTVRRKKSLTARLPLKRIGGIVFYGNHGISAALLRRCTQMRIPVSFCQAGGQYITTLFPDSRKWHDRQAEHNKKFHQLDNGARLELAKEIVSAKLNNYSRWLEEFPRHESGTLLKALASTQDALHGAPSIESIRGHEGHAAKLIYQWIWPHSRQPGLISRMRQPRKKPDRLNVLLDFSYTLLFARLNVLMRLQGLNPYLGILHSAADPYESFVCDIQELFRARIDRMVLRWVNRLQIKEDDFETIKAKRLSLKREAIGNLLEAWEKELCIRYKHENGTLGQLLEAQVNHTVAWATKNAHFALYQDTGSVKSSNLGEDAAVKEKEIQTAPTPEGLFDRKIVTPDEPNPESKTQD